jgi:hypothetical protein
VFLTLPWLSLIWAQELMRLTALRSSARKPPPKKARKSQGKVDAGDAEEGDPEHEEGQTASWLPWLMQAWCIADRVARCESGVLNYFSVTRMTWVTPVARSQQPPEIIPVLVLAVFTAFALCSSIIWYVECTLHEGVSRVIGNMPWLMLCDCVFE